jgi:hypothetical protein
MQPKTLREIRRDMHKQREWRNELERMKISNVSNQSFLATFNNPGKTHCLHDPC